MKKLMYSLAVMAGFLFVATTSATAQQAVENEKKTEQTRTGFVDKDGDGVCDHYDGKRLGKGLGPGNAVGEGRVEGQRQGRRQGLRDGRGQGERKLDGSGPGKGLRKGLRDGSGPNCAGKPNK